MIAIILIAVIVITMITISSSESVNALVENFFGGSRSLALKVNLFLKEKTKYIIAYLSLMLCIIGGGGGNGLLGRRRHLLLLHQPGRGLDNDVLDPLL